MGYGSYSSVAVPHYPHNITNLVAIEYKPNKQINSKYTIKTQYGIFIFHKLRTDDTCYIKYPLSIELSSRAIFDMDIIKIGDNELIKNIIKDELFLRINETSIYYVKEVTRNNIPYNKIKYYSTKTSLFSCKHWKKIIMTELFIGTALLIYKKIIR